MYHEESPEYPASSWNTNSRETQDLLRLFYMNFLYNFPWTFLCDFFQSCLKYKETSIFHKKNPKISLEFFYGLYWNFECINILGFLWALFEKGQSEIFLKTIKENLPKISQGSLAILQNIYFTIFFWNSFQDFFRPYSKKFFRR